MMGMGVVKISIMGWSGSVISFISSTMGPRTSLTNPPRSNLTFLNSTRLSPSLIAFVIPLKLIYGLFGSSLLIFQSNMKSDSIFGSPLAILAVTRSSLNWRVNPSSTTASAHIDAFMPSSPNSAKLMV